MAKISQNVKYEFPAKNRRIIIILYFKMLLPIYCLLLPILLPYCLFPSFSDILKNTVITAQKLGTVSPTMDWWCEYH